MQPDVGGLVVAGEALFAEMERSGVRAAGRVAMIANASTPFRLPLLQCRAVCHVSEVPEILVYAARQAAQTNTSAEDQACTPQVASLSC